MNRSTEQLLGRLKSLSDPMKLRLVALCSKAECSVSELTQVTGQSQPRISQHLKQLCAVDLLERFRDGHFVFYRVPTLRGPSASRRRLLALLPDDEPQLANDLARLRELRATGDPLPVNAADRSLHRALVELTVARPLGDLLDVGCGQGRLLKLLASRAHSVVGVDVDPDARRMARAEILLAGLPNCSLRQGDMNALPFDDAAFDTVILDDVLSTSANPVQALGEACRLLRPGGRILLLAAVGENSVASLKRDFSNWSAATGLRLAPPRAIPTKAPAWLLAVAMPADAAFAAA
ncbi:MAG: metalloregulator ArsR/SmtB family transcription factor [Gammaproteobacteria bacterium]|nr:metalloregulator ArsR/SmtB family transcription factor [Gammaproteobacteria bacterium]